MKDDENQVIIMTETEKEAEKEEAPEKEDNSISCNSEGTWCNEGIETIDIGDGQNVYEKIVEKSLPDLYKMLKEKPIIVMQAEAEIKINSMLYKFPSHEWMAVMIGGYDEKNQVYILKDIEIYDQKATSTTVEHTTEGSKQVAKRKEVLGIMHSHASMSAFCSGTDMTTAISSHISITVNNKKEYAAKVRKILPDGKIMFIEAKLVKDADYFVLTEFVEKAKEMIHLNGERFWDNDSKTWKTEKMENTKEQLYWSLICGECRNTVSRRKAQQAYCKGCGHIHHLKCMREVENREGECRECQKEDKETEYNRYAFAGYRDYMG